MQNPANPPAPQRLVPRVYRCYHDYALSSWGNVFMVSWRKNTTSAGASDLRTQCERFAAQHPEGILLLTVIHDGAPIPPPEPRAQIAAFLKSGEYIRGSAVIMEGTSFRAAIVRSIVTGLTMLAHQPFPHQICSLPQAGALFARAAEGTDIQFDNGAFQNGIAALRSRIEKELAEPGTRRLRVA